MSTKYKATMTDTGYFVTITTVGWIDVFTRLKQRYVIINAFIKDFPNIEVVRIWVRIKLK